MFDGCRQKLTIKTIFMTIYTFLIGSHSVLRWILLIAIIYSIVISIKAQKNHQVFSQIYRKIFQSTVILAHLQLLTGIVLYFMSPKVAFIAATMKNSLLRFFTVEHGLMMIVAITLITIGYSKAKKKVLAEESYKAIWVYFLIALIVILISIPWPFRQLGAGWI